MQPRRVLVVEDDEAARAVIAQQLVSCGFEPVCAGSAESALAVAMRERLDLALVDRQLPQACGASLVRWLRGSALPEVRALPVIGISSARRNERDLVAAGAACFLEKPIDPSRLHQALRWAAAVYWSGEETPGHDE